MAGVGDINKADSAINVNTPRTSEDLKAEFAKSIGRGFASENTVGHNGNNKIIDANTSQPQVSIPSPKIDLSDVTPDIRESLETSTGQLGSFSLGKVLDPDGEAISVTNQDVDDVLQANQNIDDQSEIIQADKPINDVDVKPPLAGLNQVDMKKIIEYEDLSFDVMSRVAAIESAPPEVMEKIKGLVLEAAGKLNTGNIEDVAAILSKVQTELRDSRIQFDQESLKASQEARQAKSEERIGKLVKAMEKMKEQEKTELIGKIFGGIATALAMIVGTVMIATGALSKVGVVLMIASMALMATLTVSQNTGNWMNKIAGDSQEAQLGVGIMWSVLAIALSLGAGFCNASKGATDGATQAATMTAKIAIHAKTVGHLAKMGQAAATATSAGADMHAARVGYEGSNYQASATEDLAYLTKLQMDMDDMMEAIEKAIKEINEGQEIASSVMKDTFESKHMVARNI